ncbi:hypothetical protein ACOMCU_01945 [Lysinibacillus sp. UGB7]|uniref:hypothetical protein n=1 Tax=Lysinibacillus sp. UGB7 TaxID=3411039 RepID=UPI003B7F7537
MLFFKRKGTAVKQAELEQLFLHLEELEQQYRSGEAKYYDLWLWVDTIQKAENLINGFPFAKALLGKYKTIYNEFFKNVQIPERDQGKVIAFPVNTDV